MLASSAAFSTMVDGAEQTAAWQVTITLPGNIYPDVTLAVQSVQINASATSSQPGNSRVAGTVPSTTATVVLSGMVDDTDETKTAAWLFGSWQTSSPLYRQSILRCPVVVKVGLYPEGCKGVPELFTKFTGYVDSKSIDDDGNVTLSLVDNRTLLRGSTQTPAVVTAPPFNQGLTPEFAVDWILRASTNGAIGTWPAQRSKCIFAASFRASLAPERGFMGAGGSLVPLTIEFDLLDPSVWTPTPVFGPAAYGTGLQYLIPKAGSPSTTGAVDWTMSANLGDSFFAEWWMGGSYDITDLSQRFQFNIGSTDYAQGGDATTVTIGWRPNAIDLTFTGTDGFVNSSGNTILSLGTVGSNLVMDPATPHYLSVQVNWPKGSSTATWTVRADNKTFSGTTTLNGGDVRGTTRLNKVELAAEVPSNTWALSGLQISNETAPVTNYGWTPTATLDPSINPLDYVPASTDDPGTTLQSIAEAELAVAGFVESGMFRYLNRNTLAALPLVRTLTLIESLEEDENLDTVINRVQVDYAGATVGKTGVVWSLGSVVKVPAGQTKLITAKCDTPIGGVSTNVTLQHQGASDNGKATGYRASTDRYGNTAYNGALTFTVVQTATDQVSISVRNPSRQDVWLVSPASDLDVNAGTPWLQLIGTPITIDNASTVDVQYPPVNADGSGGAASSHWGEIADQVSGNAWVQQYDAAVALGQYIVQDMPNPRPDLTNVAIIPDVRLQLMDRVALVEPDRHGITGEHALLFGWSLNYQAGQVSMTVDARTVGKPGGMLLGVAGRCELNVNTYI